MKRFKGKTSAEVKEMLKGLLVRGDYLGEEKPWGYNIHTQGGQAKEWWPVDDIFIDEDGCITCMFCGIWTRRFRSVEKFRYGVRLVRRTRCERGTQLCE